MNGTVLIVEDDRTTADWIRLYLEREGFEAETASDGRRGLDMVRSLRPDLVILDLMIPRISGTDLCQIIRNTSDVPIIMVTAKGAREDRIDGLAKGADDYVVKPFDPDELIGRVKAVLRRTRREVVHTLRCGPLEMDLERETAFLNGNELELSHAQLSLLRVFMRHPRMTLSRNQLMEQAFDNNYDCYDRAVDTHIKRLRKIIHRDDFKPIQTVYGIGYRLDCAE